jgi:ATP-dependent Clp protease protease subunit
MSEEPQRTDTTGLALIEANVWRRLFDHRTVYLRGPIMEQVADTLCAQLMALDAESDRDVTMFINSPGGEMTGMFAVYDVVQLMRSQVHTVCVGMAASAGSFLLATGTGVRSATPNSRIMIHQPHGGVQGTAADVEIQARQHLWMRERMSSIYAERTGRSLEEITRDTDRDRWFSAGEAVDYGLVDRVQIGSLPG